MDYGKICAAVCDTARKAGDFIALQMETFSYDKVEHKGAQDLVSYVDKEAEKIIVAGLREIVPEAGFITEEGTAGGDGEAGRERFKWIIDPLDGTTNFVHGMPPYAVSIALADGGRPVVGVVYEVTLRECFYAWKGSPAYMNGREIKVSSIAKLENSLIAIGLAHSSNNKIEELLRNMDYFLRNTNGVRRIGSAAADLVYVACGRFDGFYQTNLSPWDVAAGALIVECAGGKVTDYGGGGNYVFGRQLIASNSLIYDEFNRNIYR